MAQIGHHRKNILSEQIIPTKEVGINSDYNSRPHSPPKMAATSVLEEDASVKNILNDISQANNKKSQVFKR